MSESQNPAASQQQQQQRSESVAKRSQPASQRPPRPPAAIYGSRAGRPGSHRCRLTSPANSWSPRIGPCPALQRLEGVQALPYRASGMMPWKDLREICDFQDEMQPRMVEEGVSCLFSSQEHHLDMQSWAGRPPSCTTAPSGTVGASP